MTQHDREPDDVGDDDAALVVDLDRLGRDVAPPGRSVTGAVMKRIQRTDVAEGSSSHAALTRRWVMRGTIGLAASAAVAFVVFTAFGPSGSALAKALDKAAKTETVTFEIHESGGGNGGNDEGPLRVSARRSGLMRIDLPGGTYTVFNSSTGEMVTIDPVAKRAIKMRMREQRFDFYSWLKDFREGKPEPVKERVVDGKRLPGFKVVRPFPDLDGTMKDKPVTMWVDPATDLPVLAEVPEPGGVATLSKMTFDVPLGDDLFKTDVPEGYAVDDMGGLSSEQLKAATTRPAGVGDEVFTLRPGVGIGPLKFGATREEVVKAFGEPDEVKGKNGVDLRYLSKGFAMMVDTRVGLLTVNAYSKRAIGPFAANDFTGKTDKGIGMGATRAEIERAHGKPDKVNDRGAQVTLEYAGTKTTFVLLNDQLAQIVMIIPRKPQVRKTEG